ncbi:5-formyltetrahydrofolate cyclo-ligase [Polycladidibacter stylochi]|uniref:5-formyltetrahydrofolate cyclo-ligase n=1 Tax=Polycladidibacter stylochi TaxID=1807766 RepID=UPI000837887C|nr:5-formyltetrahydrofolate cyclo-ligase [Pseudovibrio stylochi]
MNTIIAEQKQQARLQGQAQRKLLPADRRKQLAMELIAHAEALCIPPAKCIAGYWPIRDEIDPRPLLSSFEDKGYPLCLPMVIGCDLEFRPSNKASLLVSAGFGSYAPAEGHAIPDVILLPLSAFDSRGGRVGYGKGYYDRAVAELEKKRCPRLIGVAFSCQEVACVPQETHDKRLDGVLCETGYRDFSA